MSRCSQLRTFFVVSSGSFSVNVDASIQISAEEAVPLDQLDKEVSLYTGNLILMHLQFT